MERIFKNSIILILSFAVLSAFAFTARAAESEEIFIGIGAPMTGSGAQYGELVRQGIELALEEINGAGGILGKKASVIYGDDKSNPNEATIVASKFGANKNMIAYIGHFNSSCTLTATNCTIKYKLPLLSYGSTSPKLTGLSPYVFRNIVSDKYQGEFLANFTAKTLNKKKAAILNENTDYGIPFAEIFKRKGEEAGLKVLYIDKFTPGETVDFSGILTKIKSMDIDCLVIIGMYREASLIAKQAREIGLNAQIVGGDGFLSEKIIELGGKAIEGAIFSGPFYHENLNPATRKFVEKFKAKYNMVPAGLAAQAYDALLIVSEAVKRAKKFDRDAVRDEIAKTKDFDGVTGKTTFDDKGDCVKELILLTVKDAKIVQYK